MFLHGRALPIRDRFAETSPSRLNSFGDRWLQRLANTKAMSGSATTMNSEAADQPIAATSVPHTYPADLGYDAHRIRGFPVKCGRVRAIPNVRRNELFNFSKLVEQFFNEIKECALTSQYALTDLVAAG
jgi:hypothetical protein